MFIRRYDSFPADAELFAIEGQVIIDLDQPGSSVAVGDVVCVVGEAINDQGVPNTVRQLLNSGELLSYYGGFKSWLGSSTDGFEGNLYAHIVKKKFPTLKIVVPDMAGGEVTFSRATTTSAVTIPAGTRVSDGAGTPSVWATLQALTIAAGTAAGTVRVRHVSGGTSALAAAIDTAVDTPPTSGEWTITNAEALAAADADAKYLDAIDATTNSSDSGDISIIFACRHTAAVIARLKQNCIDASGVGRGRICITSPPTPTVSDTATGDEGVGVGANRHDQVIYAWPAVKVLFPEHSTTELIAMPFDAWAATLIAKIPPERNPGEATDYLNGIKGLQSGITANETFYRLMKSKGICSCYMDPDVGPQIMSGITSSLESGKTTIKRRRFSFFVQDSLAKILKPYSKKLLTQSLKDDAETAVKDFFEGLLSSTDPSRQRIAGYSIDTTTPNTPALEAQGYWGILYRVRQLASADIIAQIAQVGENVTIEDAA